MLINSARVSDRLARDITIFRIVDLRMKIACRHRTAGEETIRWNEHLQIGA